MHNKIIATVGLPMFKAERIGFLALESLARQQDIDFSWELIVIEETEEAFTESRLRKYEDRLNKVGCLRIVYKSLEDWIPLSLKWLQIADEASATSNLLLLQAADCYSQPKRLKQTMDILQSENCDWVQSPIGAFFDITTGNISLFDYELVKPFPKPYRRFIKHPTALNMALRLDLLRQIKK